MQTFYMLIMMNKLLIYEKSDDGYERVSVNGNLEYEYELNKVSEGINQLVKIITDEYNLDSESDVKYIVVKNADVLVNNAVLNSLNDNIGKIISVESLIKRIIKSLSEKCVPAIDKYGINYDGMCYTLRNKKIVIEEFSLLSYTVTVDKLDEHIMQGIIDEL